MSKIKLVETMGHIVNKTPQEIGEQSVANDTEISLLNKELEPLRAKANSRQVTDDDIQGLLRNSIIKKKYVDYANNNENIDNNEFIKSLNLSESDDEDEIEEIVPPEEEGMVSDEDTPNELLTDQTDTEETDFITSDSLNEVREVLLDIPDDIQLLLLDDKAVVFGEVKDTKTYLYTLDNDESTEFNSIELPNDLNVILDNPQIIKYTESGPDERHEQIMNILMNKLNQEDDNIDVEEPEEITEPEEEEVIDDEKQD